MFVTLERVYIYIYIYIYENLINLIERSIYMLLLIIRKKQINYYELSSNNEQHNKLICFFAKGDVI